MIAMIEKATLYDVDELLSLCSSTHPSRDRAFFEYYFNEEFHGANNYYIRVDQKIVASMLMKERVLKLNQRYLLCSYIFGVSTHADYRGRGYMNELMHYVLDRSSQNYLITFIEAYNPKIYKKYGFEVIANRKKYNIVASDLNVKYTSGVSESVSASDMAWLYREFATRFDCFYTRDEAYYEQYLKRIAYEQGKVAVCVDKSENLKGYCVYFEREDMVEIKEIIYLDSSTLSKLVKYAIGYMPFISVEVSNNEKLEKIFKQAVPRTHSNIMARINNYALFEKLYGMQVKKVSEGLHLQEKPILLNEKF